MALRLAFDKASRSSSGLRADRLFYGRLWRSAPERLTMHYLSMLCSQMTSRLIGISLMTSLAMTYVGAAKAQAYPSKPLRFIVASTPGGGADFVARLIGGKLVEQ